MEEYYPSEEVTVSGWVENGIYHHLTTTDRVTSENLPSIGICPAHLFPCSFPDHEASLIEYTRKIVEGFGIKKGPIYFQYLIGKEGIRINEAACRLGGAYEDEFIPWITGVDILDIMLKMTCGLPYSFPGYDIIRKYRENKYMALQMFFYTRGILHSQRGIEKITAMKGILGGRFLLSEGTEIKTRENSTQRAGYFIAAGNSIEEVNKLTVKAFGFLKAEDSKGKSLLKQQPILLTERNRRKI